MQVFVRRVLGLLVCLCIAGVVRAEVSLPPIFSDHAVLQAGKATRIWGKAAPGEAVRVSLADTQAKTSAGADGKWLVTLDLTGKGPGPFTLTVAGTNTLTVSDVLLGEVWICSGQSNMEFTLEYALSAKEEIAQSANPLLRQFAVRHTASATPLDSVDGQWTVAGPTTSRGFTAVGYYFGKSVQQALRVPVGLVNASWNSSPVEGWTSQEALDTDPAFKKEKDYWVYLRDRFDAHVAKYHAWEAQYARQDKPTEQAEVVAAPNAATEGWTPLRLPGSLTAAGLPDAGAIWLRHTVTVDAAQAKKPLRLWFDELRFGTIYWNGVKIDEMTPDTLRAAPGWEPAWTFIVPAKLVTAGDATLAVRLVSPAGQARLVVDAKRCPLLAGDWLAKAEYTLPALDAAGKAAFPGMPPVKWLHENLMPSYLFSGMIAPLQSYAAKGVIWYQGEGNAHNPGDYAKRFALMVGDWRARFGRDLAFYVCQLPNNGDKVTTPSTNINWATFREVQAQAATLPNVGVAVLIDTADANLHPNNKKDPGERLARLALAKTYGRPVVCSGPVYASMAIEGKTVRVNFTNADGGLVAKPLPETHVLRYSSISPDVPVTAPLVLPSPGSELQGFAIRAADGAWQWAQAKLIPGKDAVLVWRDDVPNPVAVRYAWENNPTCNLYNAAGLPAAPFRTEGTVGK